MNGQESCENHAEITGRSRKMSRLDEAISSVAYILDSLMALRNIEESGNCNNCCLVKNCEHSPKLGQLVRFNCPYYVRKKEK